MYNLPLIQQQGLKLTIKKSGHLTSSKSKSIKGELTEIVVVYTDLVSILQWVFIYSHRPRKTVAICGFQFPLISSVPGFITCCVVELGKFRNVYSCS